MQTAIVGTAMGEHRDHRSETIGIDTTRSGRHHSSNAAHSQ
jgi:hypothetical protein